MISVFDWAENIVGKGENAGYRHFLFFPRFQKVFYTGSVNVMIMWLRVEKQNTLIKGSAKILHHHYNVSKGFFLRVVKSWDYVEKS